MGSDNTYLIVKKCGDIIINLKKNNEKSKTYTFRCSFCETTSDQMEQFSLHLEEFHLENFYDNDDVSNESSIIYATEIQNEPRIEAESQEIRTEILPVVKNVPLETEKTDDLLPPLKDNIKIKQENDVLNDCEFISIKTEEVSFLDDVYANDYNFSDSQMDETYSYNEEIDFSTESENETISLMEQTRLSTATDSKKKTRRYTTPKKIPNYDDIINSEEKDLNIALLKLFEQKPHLWNINRRGGPRDDDFWKKGFESIATDINAKFSKNLSWKSVKNLINAMRFKCRDEMVKELNGEEFQMPWCFEHMEYLKSNIRGLIIDRMRHKHRPNSVTIDESKLLCFIKLYQKYEELWQVNNIYFGITAKRSEIYSRMVEEMNSNHNIKFTLNHLRIYLNHIHITYSKDKERELKSEVDKSVFSPASKLYEKLTFLKDSRGPFKCPHCNIIIKTFESYHIHVAEHTGTKPFKCLQCDVYFNKFNNRITHVKRHLSETSYRCDICGKCFAVKSHLDKHKPIHTYRCQICDASFRHSKGYEKHMLRHEKRFRFECHICKTGFNQLNILNNHIKIHLNVRDKLCNVCGKSFSSKQSLKNHKLLHEDQKNFKCHVCGKEFAQGESLRVHRIRKHLRSTITDETKKEKEEAIMD